MQCRDCALAMESAGIPALMEKMRLLMQPWNVSLPAQMAAKAAAGEKEFAARTAEMTAVNRGWMREGLRACGYTVFPSCTNYLLFSGPAGLVEYAVAHGYLIRDCSNFRGLETNKGTAAIGVRQEELMFEKTEEARQYYRICIRSQKENEGLLAVLEAFLEKRKEQRNGKSNHDSGNHVERRKERDCGWTVPDLSSGRIPDSTV